MELKNIIVELREPLNFLEFEEGSRIEGCIFYPVDELDCSVGIPTVVLELALKGYEPNKIFGDRPHWFPQYIYENKQFRRVFEKWERRN